MGGRQSRMRRQGNTHVEPYVTVALRPTTSPDIQSVKRWRAWVRFFIHGERGQQNMRLDACGMSTTTLHQIATTNWSASTFRACCAITKRFEYSLIDMVPSLSPHGSAIRSPSLSFHTSTPPSPPTPTSPNAQSTLRIFLPAPPVASQARKDATALLVLRRSHNRTTPSYAPVTT